MKLAGTLTLPRGDGRHPAVLLVSGSGVQDRDETLFGHKPFWVIADHLARHGIACLRVDDRGIGGSSGDPKTATTDDFVGDALAGVAFLATQPRIDPAHIGIIGHSEGGLIGPIAATRSKQVAFVVMLAGPGVSGAELVPRQLERLLKARGAAENEIAADVDKQRAIMKIVASPRDDATARKDVTAVLAGPSGKPAPELAPQLDRLLSPWYRNFARYDPRPTLARVKVPVLALDGELDVQVDADQNVDAIKKALAHNRKAEVKRLPGLNHLFQHATTGAVDEYGTIAETIAPEVLDLITAWIRTTAAAR
ncbi:MAG TPA: alpha/beta fold hydrolase [Kofleriaceae bacterium]|nr:alpha/beta fold hydrolase [Kofleriaceae bacterium]